MGTSERLMIEISQRAIQVDLFFTDHDSTKAHRTESVQLSENSLSFLWKAGGLTFKGDLYTPGDTLFGEMAQAGIKWPVTFHRTQQEKIKVKRPQEPQPPFDYVIKEVMIPNGDIVIGATITLPKVDAGAKFPLVILASGSGPQNRDCELLGHKSFWVIADYFAKNGIATLRFDDRGVGQTTGNFQEATLEDFASDVRACVKYVASSPELKGRVKIGLAGHSEGGMHVLMAAQKNKKVAFVIELASVGTSGRDVLIKQQYLIPLIGGKSEEYANWNKELYTGMSNIVLKYDQANAQDPLTNFLDSMYNLAPAEVREQTNIFNFKIGMNMFMNTTWMRQFLAFETVNYLKKLKLPILAINGSEDIQVPPNDAYAGFQNDLSAQSEATSSLTIINGLNHLFQTCIICNVEEYGDLEETISPKVLEAMAEWILGLR